MKLFNILILFLICFDTFFSKKTYLRKLKENKIVNNNLKNLVEKDEEKNESKNKEEELLNNLLLIQKINNEIDNSITEIKEKLNKINEQKNNIDENLKNIKKIVINEDNANLFHKVKLFLYFILILAIVIYIIELKYENNKIEEKQNKRNVGSYNNNRINDNQNTKLYMSL